MNTCPNADECEYAQRDCGCGWAHVSAGEPMWRDCPYIPNSETGEIQENDHE
jgi:hypothetical protein